MKTAEVRPIAATDLKVGDYLLVSRFDVLVLSRITRIEDGTAPFTFVVSTEDTGLVVRASDRLMGVPS